MQQLGPDVWCPCGIKILGTPVDLRNLLGWRKSDWMRMRSCGMPSHGCLRGTSLPSLLVDHATESVRRCLFCSGTGRLHVIVFAKTAVLSSERALNCTKILCFDAVSKYFCMVRSLACPSRIEVLPCFDRVHCSEKH